MPASLRIGVVACALLSAPVLLAGEPAAGQVPEFRVSRGLSVHLHADRLVVAGDAIGAATIRVSSAGQPAAPEALRRRAAPGAVFLFRLQEDAASRLEVEWRGGEVPAEGWQKTLAIAGSGRPGAYVHLDGWLDFRRHGRGAASEPFRGRLLALAVTATPALDDLLFAHAQSDGWLLEDGSPHREAGNEDRWRALAASHGPAQWRVFAVGQPVRIRAEFGWSSRSVSVPAFPYIPGRYVPGEGDARDVQLFGRGGYAVRFLLPQTPASAGMAAGHVLKKARVLIEAAGREQSLDLPAPTEDVFAHFSPVAPDAEMPGYLAYADAGAPRAFFAVGRNTAWLPRPGVQYPSLFHAAARAGENLVRIWSTSWHLPLAAPSSELVLDQRNALVWDYLLLSAGRERVKVIMTLSCAHDALTKPATVPGANGAGLPDMQAFGRYLEAAAGRFWAFEALLYLEPMNEPDYLLRAATGVADERGVYERLLRPWLAAAVARLAEPSGRPVGCGMSSQAALLAVGDLLGIEQVHVYLPHTGEEKLLADYSAAAKVAEAVRIASRFGVPTIVGEFGYQPPAASPHRPDAPAHHADPAGESLRDALWAAIAAGAAGPALPWWWQTYIEKYKLGYRISACARFLGTVDVRDFTGTPVPAAAPAGVNAVVSRGRLGAIAYICAPEKPAGALRLLIPGLKPAARFRVRYFDADSGIESTVASAASDDAGRLVFVIESSAEALVVIAEPE